MYILFFRPHNRIMRKNSVYDFADEAPYEKKDRISIEEEMHRGLKIRKIEVKDDQRAYNGKGNYLSFEIDDLDVKKISRNKIKAINARLKEMISSLHVLSHPHVLMVGLGNDDFSSDALGPETIKRINANSYMEDQESKISCIIPGVMKTTGLESASIIKSLVDQFHFDLVIVFDSLTTRNVDRLYKVIQVTDTEIIPGSGIKNFRKSLNSKYLGVPLLAVGVSMAITYPTIIETILEHLDYVNDLSRKNKNYLIGELKKELILTSKDTELRVKNIGLNLSLIFNALFS